MYYHRDDESEAFNRAVRDQMRRTSRERARKEAARIDWAPLGRRAVHLVIMWVIVADLGLLLIAVRGERPLPMNFPRTDVTTTVPPHPATTGSHP